MRRRPTYSAPAQLEGKYYFAETAENVCRGVPGAAEPDHPPEQVVQPAALDHRD